MGFDFNEEDFTRAWISEQSRRAANMMERDGFHPSMTSLKDWGKVMDYNDKANREMMGK